MENLNGIEIIKRTDDGQSVSIGLYEDDNKILLSMNVNQDKDATVYFTKEELKQHIEVCQLFYSKLSE